SSGLTSSSGNCVRSSGSGDGAIAVLPTARCCCRSSCPSAPPQPTERHGASGTTVPRPSRRRTARAPCRSPTEAMFNTLVTAWFRLLGGPPCFRIYGKGRQEKEWRVIDVFATKRRNTDSGWPSPFWRGTLITWTSSVIAMGWDCAAELLREQASEPASREH